jgi:hypothetical protein
MAFDLATWHALVSDRLQNWRETMIQAAVPSVYAYLGAVTLWPVVEATRKEDWTALPTLGMVGGNRLASQIMSWTDALDGARQLASAMNAEPSLRTKLDTILRALSTLQLAEERLSPTDRQWLAHVLQAEAPRRRGHRRKDARLTGSGAIAQGRKARAIGEGAVSIGGPQQGVTVTGTVHGDITNYTYNGPPPRHPEEALAIYRRVLIAQCRRLPLRGLDVGTSDASRAQQHLDLAQVYVSLNAIP